FMPKLEWVVEKTRYTCWASIGALAVAKGITRSKCNTPWANADSCASAIEREKWVYNKYRLACDRIWCNPIPVNPGENKETKQCNLQVDRDYPRGGKCRPGSQADPLFACVANVEDANRLCGPGWKNVNTRQPTDCSSQASYSTNPFGDICCKRKEAASSDGVLIQTVEYMNDYDWSKIYSDIDTNDLRLTSADWFVEEPWDYGAYMGYVTETMEDQDPKPELSAPLFKNEFIGPFAYGFGKAIASRSRVYISGTASKSDFEPGGQGTLSGPLTWQSLLDSGEINQDDIDRQRQINPTLRMDDFVEDPRYYNDQISIYDDPSSAGTGTQTPAELQDIGVQYVSGIHGTQCFNQRNLIASGCFFNPKGGISSFPSLIQCGCVNDIYGRLDQFRNIAQSMLDCLTQVKYTGT
ncbi:MAG: hypothetical protein QF535_02890, partial [Anaerolineales bacterium]|nr:hypothetical protein [Anaerolineales bacterium]